MADPLIDPGMAEWLRQKQAALEQAVARDKAGQQDEDRKALLMQFAQQYVNQRPMPVQPRKVSAAQDQFRTMAGLEDKAIVHALAARKAQPDPDEGPPPPEWRAPQSIRTRKEARTLGWGPKAPEAADPMKGPPGPELLAALKKAGQDPSIFPTTAAALSALNARNQTPYTIVVGPDENLYRIPTRGKDAMPQAVPSPKGGGGFKKDVDLSTAESKDFSELASEFRNMEQLKSRFRDEYAGKGLTGGAEQWLAGKLGSAGTRGQQEFAKFWADFARLVDLPQRNAIFGASLTETEKSSWEQAKNIKPGTDPAIVRQAFDDLMEIVKRRLSMRGEAAISRGVGAQEVGAATGGVVGTPGENAPPVRKFTRGPDGKLVEVK